MAQGEQGKASGIQLVGRRPVRVAAAERRGAHRDVADRLDGDRAGLAGGTLSTAMQVGLAVGASVVGSVLFGLAGAHPDRAAWRHATLVTLTVEIGLALATALACTRLRRGSGR